MKDNNSLAHGIANIIWYLHRNIGEWKYMVK